MQMQHPIATETYTLPSNYPIIHHGRLNSGYDLLGYLGASTPW